MLRQVLAVLLVSVFAALALPLAAQAEEPEFVEVRGESLNVWTSGFEPGADGKTVVVFESGFATPLENWLPMAESVSSFAPVIAYDRSGIGASPMAKSGPDVENTVARLHALLSQLAPDSSYVLVGHSWGGLLVRKYAIAYPERIAGLVLIDPTDPATTEARERELFAEAGAPADGMDRFYQILMSGFGQGPAGIAAELAVIDKFRRTNPGLTDADRLPEVPVAVFLGAKLSIPPQIGEATGIDMQRFAEVMLTERLGHFAELVEQSPDGTLVLEADSGHFVHVDKPDLVLAQIRQIVESANQTE